MVHFNLYRLQFWFGFLLLKIFAHKYKWAIGVFGYVQIQDAFQQLVTLYNSDANYASNETELQVKELQKLADKMKDLNNNIGNIIAPLKNALIKRDEALYKDDSGMVDVAMSAKDYVQGVYGAGSAESKLVKKLKFTRPKKK